MSWFSNLVHKFVHIVHDIAPVLGEIGATMFGFPPGAGAAMGLLLMHAHAGDPAAKAKVARMAQDPRQRAFMNAVSAKLKEHPHFHTFRSHAGHPHGHAGPPAHGIPSRPLPFGAHAHMTVADHASGLTEHPSWRSSGGYTTGGWFDNIVKKFVHIVHDIAPVLGEMGGMMLGFPPGIGGAAGLGVLLMKAHAGDPHAKATVAALARDPRKRAVMNRVAAHLKAHPDFHVFKRHAASAPAHARHAAGLARHEEGHYASTGLARHENAHYASTGLAVHPSWASGAAHDDTFEMGRHHGHGGHGHHHGHGLDAEGIDWILGEQDVFDRIPSPVGDDGPESFRTPMHPRGVPGV